MCLIAFNWQNHSVYKLVLVANRDEYYQRPSSSLHLWEDGFYAGKDLKGKGTWMGMHPNGRFAALTNYRDGVNENERSTSRGDLVVNFLKGEMTALDYLGFLQQKKNEYNGFSLLVSDGHKMYYLSNYQAEIEEVNPGYHGLSNAFLDTPWPKVQLSKTLLKGYLKETLYADTHAVARLLQSATPSTMESFSNIELTHYLEKSIFPQLVTGEDYFGTVNTTALMWSHEGKVSIREERFIPDKEISSVQFFVKSC